jgi:hypothetical protein
MLSAWLAALASLPAAQAGSEPPVGERYAFVVVGHTRGGPENGIIPRDRLEELAREIRELEPDFVVLTGDLVYGDINRQTEPPGVVLDDAAIRADWDAVDAVFAAIGVPIHRAPGNHDVWNHSTLAIWQERYGAPYQSFRHGNGLFLLLNSCWLPAPGDPRHLPPRYIRGQQLPEDQVAWIRSELDGSAAEHVFAFMGHVLWWEPEASWWRDVHPLLAAAPTRAVFAGDLGPWKWSHLERDGIHYVQSSVEFTVPPIQMLRNREGSRAISAQLDNYVLVTVDGARVDYQVHTLGALTTGRFTPELYREINEYDDGTVARWLYSRWHTPAKMLRGVLLVGAGAFAAGLLAAATAGLIARRKRRVA